MSARIDSNSMCLRHTSWAGKLSSACIDTKFSRFLCQGFHVSLSTVDLKTIFTLIFLVCPLRCPFTSSDTLSPHRPPPHFLLTLIRMSSSPSSVDPYHAPHMSLSLVCRLSASQLYSAINRPDLISFSTVTLPLAKPSVSPSFVFLHHPHSLPQPPDPHFHTLP